MTVCAYAQANPIPRGLYIALLWEVPSLWLLFVFQKYFLCFQWSGQQSVAQKSFWLIISLSNWLRQGGYVFFALYYSLVLKASMNNGPFIPKKTTWLQHPLIIKCILTIATAGFISVLYLGEVKMPPGLLEDSVSSDKGGWWHLV